MAVSLEQAITDLRTQLENAATKGTQSAIRFVPKSVEVELVMEISKEAEAKASGSLWSVIKLGASAKAGSANTHSVKLTLEPVDKHGEPVLISSSETQED